MSNLLKQVVKKNFIIAFDFDGTCCEDNFPNIGKPKVRVLEKLKKEQLEGTSLILWTCRSGKYLEDALDWLADYGIIPDAVNENIPSLGFKTSNKIFANIYLDDRAVNVLDF